MHHETATAIGTDQLLRAIVRSGRAAPEVDRLARILDVDQADVEAAIVAAFDAGLVVPWETRGLNDSLDSIRADDARDRVTLSPLAAERLRVVLAYDPQRFKERWVKRSAVGKLERRPEPIGDEVAEPEAIDNRRPDDAMIEAEERPARVAGAEGRLRSLARDLGKHRWYKGVSAALFARAQSIVITRLVGLDQPWPVAAGPDGLCGACGGAEFPIGAVCLWCNGSGQNPDREERGEAPWWQSFEAVEHLGRRSERIVVKRPGPPTPGRKAIWLLPDEGEQPAG